MVEIKATKEEQLIFLENSKSYKEKIEEYGDFLDSEEWKSIRNKLIDERGLVCEKCYKECKKYELYVHHKNYDHEFGTERDEDLILLCGNCHNEMHQDTEFFNNISQ